MREDYAMPRRIYLYLPAYAPSRQAILFASLASISVGAFLLAYALQPSLLAVNYGIPAAHSEHAALSASATSSVFAQAQLREINIANDGLVYIKSTTIESVSAGIIVADVSWGTMTLEWNVNINTGKGGTNFIQPDGNPGSLADIQPGEVVTISGMLDTTAPEPTINAQYVRE